MAGGGVMRADAEILRHGKGWRRMAWAARDFDAAVADAPREVLHKWQTIQDHLGDMPPGTLRDLLVEFWRAVGYLETGHANPDAIAQVIDYWYRRALSVKTQAKYPSAQPIEDWSDLPDRTFS